MKLPDKYIEHAKAPMSLAQEISKGNLLAAFVKNENISNGAAQFIGEELYDRKLQQRLDKLQMEISRLAQCIVRGAKSTEMPLQDILYAAAAYTIPASVQDPERTDLKFSFQLDKMNERARQLVERMQQEDPHLLDEIFDEAQASGFAAEYEKNDRLTILCYYVTDHLPEILELVEEGGLFMSKMKAKNTEK